MIDEETPPALQLGPYTVEFTGKRRGLLALQICIGRNTIELFATPAKGLAARVTAEIDGWALVRRKKRRPYRVWSNDLRVKRWVISAASEADDGRPRWTARQIAHNLRRNSGTGADMSESAIHRMTWRLSPGLARRRGDFWRTKTAERPAIIKKVRSQKDVERRAALKAAQEDELRRAGLL